MAGKMNRSAYERLIKEDLAWLRNNHYDRSLPEAAHIECVLQQSIDLYYPPTTPKSDDERDKRIAELECALAEEERKAHEELRAHEQITVRAERAEAALREVAELPDKWDSQISPEMLEWLNVCESPPSQANELRGILSKYKEKP
jgi:hypothetical protein